jgi:hypothetical protein
MNERWEVVYGAVSDLHHGWYRSQRRAERVARHWTRLMPNLPHRVKKEDVDEHRSATRDRDDSNTVASGITFATGGSFHTGASIVSRPGVIFTGHIASVVQEPLELKESTSEIPILAYKVARLVWLPNQGPRLASLNQGRWYAADADATCSLSIFTIRSAGSVLTPMAAKRDDHDSPVNGCSCGFYACTDLSMLEGGAAILEVELSGRVIVCERGYRAGHQRVIRAHLRGCHYCGQAPSVASFEADCELRLRCEQHADATPSTPISDLSKLLGVPVDVDSSVGVS